MPSLGLMTRTHLTRQFSSLEHKHTYAQPQKTANTCMFFIHLSRFIKQIRTNDSKFTWRHISLVFNAEIYVKWKMSHRQWWSIVNRFCRYSLSNIFISKSIKYNVYFGANRRPLDVHVCVLNARWKGNAKVSKVNQTYVTFNEIVWLICASTYLCLCVTERARIN